MIRVRHLSLVLLICGCGGSDKGTTTPNEVATTEQTAPAEPVEPPATPAETPAQPPPPPPKKLTTEELIKAHDACFAAFVAKDEKKYTDCYTAESTDELVDSGMPVAKGAQQALESAKQFWNAFPDLSGAIAMNLGNGNSLAVVAVVTGTNTAEMMGHPATNKKFGQYALEIIDMTDDGRHGNVRLYVDLATMAAQIGHIKQKSRPVAKKPDGEPKVAIATDSETERKNVKTVTDGIEAWNKRDWKAVEASYTKDVVFSDQMMPADAKGAKNAVKALQAYAKGFSDGKVKVDKIWGAGDYVVAEQTFTGTNDGVLPAMGVKKKTGKPVTIRFATVLRLEGDKVKEEGLFANGMAIAMQLGLMSHDHDKGAEKPEKKPGEKK